MWIKSKVHQVWYDLAPVTLLTLYPPSVHIGLGINCSLHIVCAASRLLHVPFSLLDLS